MALRPIAQKKRRVDERGDKTDVQPKAPAPSSADVLIRVVVLDQNWAMTNAKATSRRAYTSAEASTCSCSTQVTANANGYIKEVDSSVLFAMQIFCGLTWCCWLVGASSAVSIVDVLMLTCCSSSR